MTDENRSHDDDGEMVQESGSYCGSVCVQIASLGNGMSAGVLVVVGSCYRCRGHGLGVIVGAGDDHECLSHPFAEIRFQKHAASLYLLMFSMADCCEILTSWRGGLVHPVGFCLLSDGHQLYPVHSETLSPNPSGPF